MKILVIDRDDMTCLTIRKSLEGLHHDILEEAVKNNAIELAGHDGVDVVIFDPTPLTNARPVVLGLRRSMRAYPYVIIASESIEFDDAMKMGANDSLSKPLDKDALYKKIENAQRLTDLVRRVGDETEDFPSAGGVIAKSAFNQLILSALDRADRYGELSYLVMINIENYNEVKSLDGPYAAEYAVSKLAQHLVKSRRQSDIIAQTGKSEYALLLQRPVVETEPEEAANRFAETLAEARDVLSDNVGKVEISIRLIALPSGYQGIEHFLCLEQEKPEAS